MWRTFLCGASVSLTLLSGCASTPSTAPTAMPPRQTPQECLTPCPPPPPRNQPRLQWEAKLFRWGADCAALHQECMSGVAPEGRAGR